MTNHKKSPALLVLLRLVRNRRRVAALRLRAQAELEAGRSFAAAENYARIEVLLGLRG